MHEIKIDIKSHYRIVCSAFYDVFLLDIRIHIRNSYDLD